MFEDNKKSANKFGESINELSNDNFNINSNYNLNVPNSNMKKGTFKSLLNDSNLLSEKEIKRNQRISDMKMKEEELKNKLKSLK